MTRLFKFRFWNRRRKKFEGYKHTEFRRDGTCFSHNNLDGYHTPGSDFEIQQYTGLKDKNDREIYEGDIIRWIGPHDNEFKGKVEFHNSRFRAWDTRNKIELPFDSRIEIIGNIFQNKNLLD